MNHTPRWFVTASLAALLAALPEAALAFPQPPEPRERDVKPAAEASPADTAAAPDSASGGAAKKAASKERRRAEELYAKGYEEAHHAGDLDASGKTKDARKEFERALNRFEEAVRLDDRYFEAWNMIGYCARRTGDLKRSFDAYDRCLALSPDYEPAHEYRGEAYLMSGEIEKAKTELAWLRDRKSAQAEILEAAIETAEKGKAGGDRPVRGW